MFKVLIPRSKDLTENNIRVGWANAFTWLGKKSVWLENGKAPLDLWHEEYPDIVIIKQSELTEGIVKAINKYGTVVFLFWEGREQPLVEKIKTNVFLFQDRLYKAATGLNPFNSLPKIIYPAADTIRFKPGTYRKELAADLTYIGTWHPRKTELLKYFEQRKLLGDKVRIWGWGEWNHPLHVGPIESDGLFADVIASTKNIFYLFNSSKFYNISYLLGKNSSFVAKYSSDSPILPLPKAYLDGATYIDRVQEMLSCLKN